MRNFALRINPLRTKIPSTTHPTYHLVPTAFHRPPIPRLQSYFEGGRSLRHSRPLQPTKPAQEKCQAARERRPPADAATKIAGFRAFGGLLASEEPCKNATEPRRGDNLQFPLSRALLSPRQCPTPNAAHGTELGAPTHLTPAYLQETPSSPRTPYLVASKLTKTHRLPGSKHPLQLPSLDD